MSGDERYLHRFLREENLFPDVELRGEGQETKVGGNEASQGGDQQESPAVGAAQAGKEERKWSERLERGVLEEARC